jgi:hypothetical protein
MSERGRVALIFASIALVAGGAGYYFFKIYSPAKELEGAQAEVVSWEARWQAARDCLLGKSPGSSRTSEALAIREMNPDPWDRGRCTPLISKLTRGPAPDTGMPAVEQAWLALDKAAGAAANAFAKHVGSSTTLVDNPLPGALDNLDAARATLRRAVQLPASEQTSLRPLDTATIVPIEDGSEPVTSLTVDALPSARGLVLFGKTESRMVQIALPMGGAPLVGRVGPGSFRAPPELNWGATGGPMIVRGAGKKRDSTGEVRAGLFDAEGALPSPTTLPIVMPLPDRGNVFEDPGDLAPGDQFGAVTIAGAVGTLEDGAAVYGGYRTLAIARASGGSITAEPPLAIDTATMSVDVDGRGALVWSTPDGAPRARLFGPGTDGAVHELPDPVVGAPCLTRERAWVKAIGESAFSFGGGQPAQRVPVPRSAGLTGCTPEAALFRVRDQPTQVIVCTDTCRSTVVPAGAPTYSAVTAVGGKVVAIAAHGGVLGVWREGQGPVFYALPVDAKPVLAHEWPAMALTDGNAIDVLARGSKTFVVIRIPAS